MLLWWIVGIAAIAICARIYAKGKSNPYKPDLTGKLILVSGGTAGIGKETAATLYSLGADVIITGRDQQKGKDAAEEIKSRKTIDPAVKNSRLGLLEYMHLDMADINDIKRFAKEFLAKYPVIDILINNAGMINTDFERTKQDLEMTVGVNLIGTMYLTHHLFEAVRKAPQGRIINVSSVGYILEHFVQIKTKDGERGPEDFLVERIRRKEDHYPFFVYAKTKLGVILFTQYLAKLIEQNNIKNLKVATLHPGSIATDIYHPDSLFFNISRRIFYPILVLFLKSPRDGAQTTLCTACMPFEELRSGAYYSECQYVPNLWKVAHPNHNEFFRRYVWNVCTEKISHLTGGEQIFSQLTK